MKKPKGKAFKIPVGKLEELSLVIFEWCDEQGFGPIECLGLLAFIKQKLEDGLDGEVTSMGMSDGVLQ